MNHGRRIHRRSGSQRGRRRQARARAHSRPRGPTCSSRPRARGARQARKLDPAAIEDVVCGCVTPIGEQGFNIGRMAVLEAGWPVEVTGATVNRMCGSSQQAVHQAAHAVMAGQADVTVGCGVEMHEPWPMGSDGMVGPNVWPPAPSEYKYEFVSQGTSAEMIAERWKLSRKELDELSLESHKRAVAAQEKGEFDREIVPLEVTWPGRPEARVRQGRGPARQHVAREARDAADGLQGRRRGPRRQQLADLRRRGCRAHRERGGLQEVRPQEARPHHRHGDGRRRARHHAHRRHPGDQARPRARRPRA